MSNDKEKVKQTIADTVEAFAPGADPSALFSIAKRESAFNPEAMGDSGKSWGLYQMRPPYYLRLWGGNDPNVFLDPKIATVIAMRVWNKAVAAGARNPIEVRLFWWLAQSGLKNNPPGSPEYEKRRETETKRFESLGYPGSYATRDARSFGYGPAGFGPAPNDQAILATIGGASSSSSFSWLRLLSLGLLVWKVLKNGK